MSKINYMILSSLLCCGSSANAGWSSWMPSMPSTPSWGSVKENVSKAPKSMMQGAANILIDHYVTPELQKNIYQFILQKLQETLNQIGVVKIEGKIHTVYDDSQTIPEFMLKKTLESLGLGSLQNPLKIINYGSKIFTAKSLEQHILKKCGVDYNSLNLLARKLSENFIDIIFNDKSSNTKPLLNDWEVIAPSESQPISQPVGINSFNHDNDDVFETFNENLEIPSLDSRVQIQQINTPSLNIDSSERIENPIMNSILNNKYLQTKNESEEKKKQLSGWSQIIGQVIYQKKKTINTEFQSLLKESQAAWIEEISRLYLTQPVRSVIDFATIGSGALAGGCMSGISPLFVGGASGGLILWCASRLFFPDTSITNNISGYLKNFSSSYTKDIVPFNLSGQEKYDLQYVGESSQGEYDVLTIEDNGFGINDFKKYIEDNGFGINDFKQYTSQLAKKTVQLPSKAVNHVVDTIVDVVNKSVQGTSNAINKTSGWFSSKLNKLNPFAWTAQEAEMSFDFGNFGKLLPSGNNSVSQVLEVQEQPVQGNDLFLSCINDANQAIEVLPRDSEINSPVDADEWEIIVTETLSEQISKLNQNIKEANKILSESKIFQQNEILPNRYLGESSIFQSFVSPQKPNHTVPSVHAA